MDRLDELVEQAATEYAANLARLATVAANTRGASPSLLADCVNRKRS